MLIPNVLAVPWRPGAAMGAGGVYVGQLPELRQVVAEVVVGRLDVALAGCQALVVVARSVLQRHDGPNGVRVARKVHGTKVVGCLDPHLGLHLCHPQRIFGPEVYIMPDSMVFMLPKGDEKRLVFVDCEVHLVLQCFDNSGGYPGGQCPVRDVVGHHGTGGHDGTLADMYARQDGYIDAHPGVAADNSRCYKGFHTLCVALHRGAVGQNIVVAGQRCTVFDADEVRVRVVEYAVGPDVYLVSYADAAPSL